MDDVERECWDLLQSIGLAPKPASLSPPIEPESAAAGPSNEKEVERARGVDAAIEGGMKGKPPRSVGKPSEGTSKASRASLSNEPSSATSRAPTQQYYVPRKKAPDPPPKASSPASDRRDSLTSSQERGRSHSPPRQASASTNPAALYNLSTLHVSYLDSTTTREDLQRIFSVFGTIKSIRPRTVKNNYIAFVEFQHSADAKVAIRRMNNSLIGKGHVGISYASYDPPCPPCRTLVASPIGSEITKQQVAKVFRNCGRVHSVRIIVSDKLAHILTAFVDFERLADAIRATETFNGTVLGSQEIEVKFSRDESLQLRHECPEPRTSKRSRSRSPVAFGPGPLARISSSTRRAEEESRILIIKNLPPGLSKYELDHRVHGLSLCKFEIKVSKSSCQAIVACKTRQVASIILSSDGITIQGRQISISLKNDSDPSPSSSRHVAPVPSSSSSSSSRVTRPRDHGRLSEGSGTRRPDLL